VYIVAHFLSVYKNLFQKAILDYSRGEIYPKKISVKKMNIKIRMIRINKIFVVIFFVLVKSDKILIVFQPS
jgi:hypothetical protein